MQLSSSSFQQSPNISIGTSPTLATGLGKNGRSLLHRSVTFDCLSTQTTTSSTASSEELIPKELRLTPTNKFELERQYQKMDSSCINEIFSKANNYPENIPSFLKQRILNISHEITALNIVGEISVGAMQWVFDNFNLQSLELTFSKITAAYFKKSSKVEKLQSLICKDVEWKADQCLKDLNIHHLAFARCHGVNDRTMDSITHLENVKKIELIAQPFISIIGFSLLRDIESLTSLKIEGCPSLADWSLKRLAEGINNLQDITIVNCPEISWKGLQTFRQLECADIIHLTEIIDNGETGLHIQADFGNTFALSIRIINCHQITSKSDFFNIAVRELSNICVNVKHFVMQNSATASVAPLIYLQPIKNNPWVHPHLIYLEKVTAKNCKNINTTTVKAAFSNIMISADLNSTTIDLYFMPDKRVFNATWPLLSQKLHGKIDPSLQVVLEPLKDPIKDTGHSIPEADKDTGHSIPEVDKDTGHSMPEVFSDSFELP